MPMARPQTDDALKNSEMTLKEGIYKLPGGGALIIRINPVMHFSTPPDFFNNAL
jgi:hypothetical protein